jgi:hypothetical protein
MTKINGCLAMPVISNRTILHRGAPIQLGTRRIFLIRPVVAQE